MVKVTHRCSCGKGVRLYLKPHRYRGTEMRYFIEADSLKRHPIGPGHYITGIEPAPTTLDQYGVEV